MTHHLQLLPGALTELVSSVEQTGYVTLADRYGLMAAILDESLPDQDRKRVNRVLQGVKRGDLIVSPTGSTASDNSVALQLTYSSKPALNCDRVSEI